MCSNFIIWHVVSCSRLKEKRLAKLSFSILDFDDHEHQGLLRHWWWASIIMRVGAFLYLAVAYQLCLSLTCSATMFGVVEVLLINWIVLTLHSLVRRFDLESCLSFWPVPIIIARFVLGFVLAGVGCGVVGLCLVLRGLAPVRLCRRFSRLR